MRAPVVLGDRVLAYYHQNRSTTSRWNHQICALLGVGATLYLLFMPLSLRAQGTGSVEYRAKANFLANSPSFIDWPADGPPFGQASFLVCVFGDFSFGTSLAEMTRGTTIHERRIEIRWVRKEQELRSCQILFVSQSEHKRYDRILYTLRGLNVLTVGESPEFLEAGGIVSLSMQQGILQFDVNLEAANRAHLKISSRMLTLARRIVNQAEAAKG